MAVEYYPKEKASEEALKLFSVDRKPLSWAEFRVLDCLFEGLGVPPVEVARRLNVSLCTVRNHMKSAYRKTGTRNPIELALWYFGGKP